MKSVRIAPIVAGTVVGTLAGSASASVTFTSFGSSSRVNAISADGSTAVGRTGGRAVRWAGGAAHDLNTFGSGLYSTASAVSADGSVIVGNAYNNDFFSPNTVAYRWTAGGGAASMGATGGSYEGWGALGVSANGAVVVGRAGFSIGAAAFGAPFGPPVSYGRSSARGVSADGTAIVGITRNSEDDRDQAFRWSSAGGVQMLGSLLGGVNSSAAAISGDGGTVVGWSESASGRQAFRWSAVEGMIGLGDLPGGAFDSEAVASSADGSAIFGTGTDAAGPAAVRWTASGAVPVQFLLTGAGVDLTGWRLTGVSGVSADGLTLVGNGIDPLGQPQGWMAMIPSPGVPLVAGFAAIFSARRRAR